jgi:hypothetical protein
VQEDAMSDTTNQPNGEGIEEPEPDDLEIGGQGGDSVTDEGARPETTDDDGTPLENPAGG